MKQLKKEDWSKQLEGPTKAIILNEETDEKVVIEIPKAFFVIDILLEQICTSEDYMENAEEGDPFDIGNEFLQEQFLELSKPFFKIDEDSYIDFIEPSEEEKLSGIIMIANLSKV